MKTPLPPLTLDEAADRTIAGLTRRLSQAAEWTRACAEGVAHDFLVTVPHPDFVDVGQLVRDPPLLSEPGQTA